MKNNIVGLLESKNYCLQEYNLLAETGIEYWHTSILDNYDQPISGGFGPDKNYSRKVAFAEYLERTKFFELSKGNSTLIADWGLDKIPTGCGFAAGFNERNVIIRSLGEALERWVASKWIDDQYCIPKSDNHTVLKALDPISNWFCKQFDSVDFYEKEVGILLSSTFLTYKIGIVTAFKNGGVFVGSSAQVSDGNLWQHALLESFRHFQITNNVTPKNMFPDNRIRFFSKNANIAIEQIKSAIKTNWPAPVIGMHKVEQFKQEQFILARTIVSGWASWHLGPVDRFLY